MADGQVAPEARELALVEDGGDQAHVLHDGDGVAVADRHAGRLLAPVLEGVEAVEGEVGDAPPRGVDPEDAAGFLGLHHRLVTAHTGGRRRPHGPAHVTDRATRPGRPSLTASLPRRHRDRRAR